MRGEKVNRKSSGKTWGLVLVAIFLSVACACSRKTAPAIVVEIPAGFTGDFLLEMGVKGAPPLEKQGDSYFVAVPKSGKVETSTLLTNSTPVFKNATDGAVWGYAHSVFTTGDGIATGGKIEFFVGTRKEYDAEQSKKNHSGGASIPEETNMIST
jgi:hypothetical protein